MARKGLGKGLDSLIPNFYDEDFDSNSPQSLEDMLKENEEPVEEEVEPQKEEQKNIFEEIQEEEAQKEEAESEVVEEAPEEVVEEEPVPEELPEEVKIQNEHVAEVKEIVDKNPRITLWSSRSSAVFRYLRKTEPEFSISKEASVLIEEAVSKKYPEIWALFDDYWLYFFSIIFYNILYFSLEIVLFDISKIY